MDMNTQEAIRIRELYETDLKRFECNQNALDTWHCHYILIEREKKYARIAQGQVGTISDCFILYVLASWGCMDRYALQKVLVNLKNRHRDLFMADYSITPNFDGRIDALKKSGFLFSLRYATYGSFDMQADKERGIRDANTFRGRVVLYTIDRDAHTIMNTALSKHVSMRDWMQAAREYVNIGQAAASYVGACLTDYEGFYDITDGRVRTKEVGNAFVSAEVSFRKEHKTFLVGVLSIFLRRDKRVMTKHDYNNVVSAKLNLIRNYFFTRKHYENAYLILVCENNEDLEEFANFFHRTSFMEELLPNIYFANEAAIRSFNHHLNDSLIQMVYDDNEESGYRFVHSSIPALEEPSTL